MPKGSSPQRSRINKQLLMFTGEFKKRTLIWPNTVCLSRSGSANRIVNEKLSKASKNPKKRIRRCGNSWAMCGKSLKTVFRNMKNSLLISGVWEIRNRWNNTMKRHLNNEIWISTYFVRGYRAREMSFKETKNGNWKN